MKTKVIDIHPHIIADNEERYPRAPLFGVQSDWSRTRPVTVDRLIAAMEEAGVGKAAVVQASTCYGHDNTYLTDSIARYPDRLTAVAAIDILDGDAPRRLDELRDKGVAGLRLFTGGSTAAVDASWIDDPRTEGAWRHSAAIGFPVCIQTSTVGLAQVEKVAEKYADVQIILDHLARPDLSDGPPYEAAKGLFDLARFPNIYLKASPRTFHAVGQGRATSESFFDRLIGAFGANRIAWGSNYPASEGSLSELLGAARAALASVSEEDRSWIFARTAQILYPSLADR